MGHFGVMPVAMILLRRVMYPHCISVPVRVVGVYFYHDHYVFATTLGIEREVDVLV